MGIMAMLMKAPAAGGSVPSVYQTTILAESSLLAYYPLDEAAGATSVLDRKGTNHLTVGSGASLGLTGLTASGKTCAQIATIATAAFQSSAKWADGTVGTMEFILKLTALVHSGSFAQFVANGNGTGTGHGVCGTSAGNLQLWNNSAANANSTLTMSTGTVYHLAVAYDGAGTSFYVNGALQNSVAGTAETTAGAACGVGIRPPSTSNMVGFIQDVAVYSAKLSASAVLAHYNARNSLGVRPPPRPP